MTTVKLPKLTWRVAHNVHTASVLNDLIRIVIEWDKNGYKATLEGITNITLPDRYFTPTEAKTAAKAKLRAIVTTSLVFSD